MDDDGGDGRLCLLNCEWHDVLLDEYVFMWSPAHAFVVDRLNGNLYDMHMHRMDLQLSDDDHSGTSQAMALLAPNAYLGGYSLDANVNEFIEHAGFPKPSLMPQCTPLLTAEQFRDALYDNQLYSDDDYYKLDAFLHRGM